MNIKDPAAYLSVTQSFVRATFVYGGAIKKARLGNRWVFDRKDIDAYLERSKQ